MPSTHFAPVFGLRCGDLVVERFERQLTCKGQYMSKGGRLSLTKSTLCSLPVYFWSLLSFWWWSERSWKNYNLLWVMYEKVKAIGNGLQNKLCLKQQDGHDILLSYYGWISLLFVALANLGLRIHDLFLIFYLLLTWKSYPFYVPGACIASNLSYLTDDMTIFLLSFWAVFVKAHTILIC